MDNHRLIVMEKSIRRHFGGQTMMQTNHESLAAFDIRDYRNSLIWFLQRKPSLLTVTNQGLANIRLRACCESLSESSEGCYLVNGNILVCDGH
jgi:hypothetical protein